MTPWPPLGTGPPLLYLPGMDGTGELLFVHEAALARRFTLLRHRYPKTGDFTYESLAGDAAAALDEACCGPSVVLAESFGGAVAIRMALDRPDLVSRLVLVNSFAYFPKRSLLWFGRTLGAQVGARNFRRVKRAIARPSLRLDGVPASSREQFLRITQPDEPSGYRRRLELIASLDVRPWLSRVTQPALVVIGSRDRLVPRSSATELVHSLSDASLLLLPRLGHAALLHESVDLVGLLESTSPRRDPR